MALRIGTAGWATPRAVADQFPAEGSVLQRYAAVFDAVEINTTFYRPHRPQTFERWAEDTPPGFRFAVKAPKAVTHEARLIDCETLMDVFLSQVRHLGEKLGPILIQLPPSLKLDVETAGRFFASLRDRYEGPLVCEPRHETWFSDDAERLWHAYRIARVGADPARSPAAAHPGGLAGFVYRRLHGSPRMYFSPYPPEVLKNLAHALAGEPESWCIFDNTASGAAAADALTLKRLTQT